MHIIAFIEILVQLYFINHAYKTGKPYYWFFMLLIPVVGFLIYFLDVYLPEILHDQEFENSNSSTFEPAKSGTLELIYISRGKLYHKNDNSKPTQIQSSFGQKIIDKALEKYEKNKWKSNETGTYFGGNMLWGTDQIDPHSAQVSISGATINHKSGGLYYTLESKRAGGLFSYEPETQQEKRLFHTMDFSAKDLDSNPQTGQIVCSRSFPNGTSSIFLMNEDGSNARELTEGDSIDEAPSWIPGKESSLLFQSSGIARSKEGYLIARGPSTVQSFNLEKKVLITVLEHPQYDYIQPRVSSEGDYYFVRRPYDVPKYTLLEFVSDTFLFPFRLLRAVFHYLNFFSLVYSKKPLTTSSGPKINQDDLKTIILKGKTINAEKSLRNGQKIMGVPSLVPSSWALIKRDRQGNETIMARSVVAFDINPDGIIAYSNGFGIFTLNKQGIHSLVLQDKLIEEIKILN